MPAADHPASLPAEPGGAAASGRRRAASIRSLLVLLAVLYAASACLPAAYLIWSAYRTERRTIEKHSVETVRALSLALDGEFGRVIASLQALATSPSLEKPDLPRFRDQALQVVSAYPDSAIVLSDASGHQLMNTLRPIGEELPRRSGLEPLRHVFETGSPAISNYFIGAVSKRPIISVDVPVFRAGRVAYDLAIGLPAEHFADILRRQNFPAGWVGSIFDRGGRHVARTQAADQFVGQTGAPALMRALSERSEGTGTTRTLEGIPVFYAFSRSERSGWAVAIGVPREALRRQLLQSVAITAGAAATLLVAGLVLAVTLGRRIAGPLQVLRLQSLALGRGELVTVRPLGLREVDEVAGALAAASRLLRQRDAERQVAEAELTRALREKEGLVEQKEMLVREMNHRVKNSLQSVSAMLRLQAGNVGDARLSEQLLEADHRVLTIARVHEQFYRQFTLGERIDVRQFLRDLCEDLRRSELRPGKDISLQVEADRAELAADQAIPLALIVNELVTNAFKYAFEGRNRGTVSVAFRDEPGGRRWIGIADDGCGLPDGFAPEHSRGLGMKLVMAFVQALDGELAIDRSGPGTRFTIKIGGEAARR